MKQRIRPVWLLLLSLAVPLAVGGLAARIVGESTNIYEALRKPPLAPPGQVFPFVWSALYVLMGIGIFLAVRADVPVKEKRRALLPMALQLGVNFFWPILFFRGEAFLFAFFFILLLLFLVIAAALSLGQVKKAAAWLQLPYIIWTAFAAYLNFGVWLLNR